MDIARYPARHGTGNHESQLLQLLPVGNLTQGKQPAGRQYCCTQSLLPVQHRLLDRWHAYPCLLGVHPRTAPRHTVCRAIISSCCPIHRTCSQPRTSARHCRSICKPAPMVGRHSSVQPPCEHLGCVSFATQHPAAKNIHSCTLQSSARQHCRAVNSCQACHHPLHPYRYQRHLSPEAPVPPHHHVLTSPMAPHNGANTVLAAGGCAMQARIRTETKKHGPTRQPLLVLGCYMACRL
jgi:hypothetical protein